MSQTSLQFQTPRRKKPFNLHRFIISAKLVAVEILSAIVFFLWLYDHFIDEVRRLH